MKKLGLIALAVIMVMNAKSQTILKLYEGEIPNNKITGETEKWDTTDLVRVGNVQVPDIAIYLPPKRVATGQAIVICPGGGYGRLSYQWEGIEIAKWFNSNGIAAFILKYRLPYTSNNIVSYKSPLLDAKRALRLVRFNAEKWNINPDQIGIMGFSAGGHLASTLLTQFDAGDSSASDEVEKLSSRPDFGILIYPVISMYEPNVHKGSRDNLLGKGAGDELKDKFSSHLNVSASTPPTFLVHAADDRAVPLENSLLFAKALSEKKVPVEMHIYPFGGHGFSMGLHQKHVFSWTERCIDWMKWLGSK